MYNYFTYYTILLVYREEITIQHLFNLFNQNNIDQILDKQQELAHNLDQFSAVSCTRLIKRNIVIHSSFEYLQFFRGWVKFDLIILSLAKIHNILDAL